MGKRIVKLIGGPCDGELIEVDEADDIILAGGHHVPEALHRSGFKPEYDASTGMFIRMMDVRGWAEAP